MVGRAGPHKEDPVTVSEEAGQRSRSFGPGSPGHGAPRPKSAPAVRSENLWPADLEDGTSRDEAVAYEMERRAGSFMRPKYPPFPPPKGIPKAKRRPRVEK